MALPPEFDQLCDLMQKSEWSPFAIIGISIAAGSSNWILQRSARKSIQASKQGHVFEIHCSEEEKKALQNVLCPFNNYIVF
jgi:hypothetical protein